MKEMPVSYHPILDRLEREERRLLNRKPLLSMAAQKDALDHGWPTSCDFLEREMGETARVLADRLLLVKFVQGLPLVGAVGGAANLSLSGRVSRFGALKYEKRFLERKVRGL